MLHSTQANPTRKNILLRGATFVGVAAALLAAGTLMGGGIASGRGPGGSNSGLQPVFCGTPGTAKWEYAEFTIQADRAIVVGQTAAQELLPPVRLDDRDTVFENNAGQFVARFNLRLFYINLMGSEGWEFTDGVPIEENKTVMVRRQKK